MGALAKVKTNPSSYVFKGGDACHHGSEFRPSPYHPLPEFLTPAPSSSCGTNSPGSLFGPLLRGNGRNRPFYAIARRDDGTAIVYDVDEAETKIEKVMEMDASDEVLLVMAHDETLKDVVSFFPHYTNSFRESGRAEKGRWFFLRDFMGAVKD
ncbi:uncharacterized protein EAF01_006022 [Botrytis porri]|uniref:Uncharacterized protein n=1 Tax=Botrytis porri TaxID=87229 RepID=A0A4Z1K8M8_9HELO|nr:uncharacterized protein EAF01_006022 [Botrytis porri]KAF7905501.1 hypothetical protein EAF01_006022 [Botrytis porri]TGO82010.1 hypothetical protein BPOR_0945g00030 [Botrytis porri]